MIKNILRETLEILCDYKKAESEVLWVGTNKEWMSWEEFKDIARLINYNSGFGWPDINVSLMVVGIDWWLERYEYDGAEEWRFKRLPEKPKSHNVNISITGELYDPTIKNID